MFSSAAHSAIHFARRSVFATVSKQARFLSVSTVSCTKNFYTESVLLSEKSRKAAKAKKSNGRRFEQSQLYPDELEKLGNYELMEEFDLLMNDDKTPSVGKDLISGEVESAARKSEAVDKMTSMQEVDRAVGPKSVTKKSDAIHNRQPMQEMERPVWPQNVVRKPEAFEEVKMPEMKEIDLKEIDLISGEVESAARKSEAVDKMTSMQEVDRAVGPKSVTKKSDAIHNRQPMQEMERPVWPQNVVRKPEAFEEVKMPEMKEIDLKEIDLDEGLSDSDSESDTEDHFGSMRERVLNNFAVNLDDLNITRLGRRSTFFRREMEKASSRKNGMVFHDEIGGIFALAKMGITPEALFACSTEILKYYPQDLSKTTLYVIPLEDMKYWATKVKNFRTAMIALYKEENLRLRAGSSEPEMPVTIICDRIWHRIGFAQIINSAYITPPKLFITSKDCVSPWHGTVVRNSIGHGTLLNHDFGLSWEEIGQKVDKDDNVYVVELMPTRDYDGGGTDHWASLPSVRLYNHSFWDGKNITLIALGSYGKRVPQELSEFCIERKASKIDTGLTKKTFGLTPFHMVLFEMRRQWLAEENGKACRSGLKNVKTAKSRNSSLSTRYRPTSRTPSFTQD